MTDLDLLETDYQEIITTFVLNTMLHHVSVICIIENHEYLKYDTGSKKSDWMTGGPWYNTFICKKLHWKVLEEFIINAVTDRYNIMCSIDAYGRENQSYSRDDGISGGVCPLPTNSTTEALYVIGATNKIYGCTDHI